MTVFCLGVPRMICFRACASLLCCFSDKSEHLCILWVLSKHSTHESSLVVNACVLNCCVVGLVGDETVRDDPDRIAITFNSLPDPCLIEIDLVSDDVITFIF